jgi:hypothetical protein
LTIGECPVDEPLAALGFVVVVSIPRLTSTGNSTACACFDDGVDADAAVVDNDDDDAIEKDAYEYYQVGAKEISAIIHVPFNKHKHEKYCGFNVYTQFGNPFSYNIAYSTPISNQNPSMVAYSIRSSCLNLEIMHDERPKRQTLVHTQSSTNE